MNRAIEHGVFYTHDEAMRLLKIARERGCSIKDIPDEEKHPIEIKWFSNSEEENE